MRVLPTGKVQVVTGATPHGQGHETTWSMIVGRRARRSPRRRRGAARRHRVVPLGLDTYGVAVAARSAASPSTTPRDKVIAKARTIAAHQLEAAEDDLEFAGGDVHGQGRADRSRRLPALAFAAFTAHDLPGRHGARPRARRTLRPAELLVALRHAHLRGRGRHRDRATWSSSGTSRSTTAATSQPADRRRPGARRRRPGHRRRRCSRRRSTTRTATC